MSTNLQSHIWGELYNMGCKLTYARGTLRFHFIDLFTGKETYSIICDLSTEKGRAIADEIRWSHAFPLELFDKVEEYIKRWVHASN